MSRLRTVSAVVRQQAGWLAGQGHTGLLSRDEVLFVRFYSIWKHENFPNRFHFDDLTTFEEMAGLDELGDYYWMEPQDGCRGGMGRWSLELSRDGGRLAHMYARSWAYSIHDETPIKPKTSPLSGRSDPFEAIETYLFDLTPLVWTWWSGFLRDNDTIMDITARAMSMWVRSNKIDRRRKWTADELMREQAEWARRTTSPRLDRRGLEAAAEASGLRLASAASGVAC